MTLYTQVAIRKVFFEEHLPKGLKVYEERFAPECGFFTGDTVSITKHIFESISAVLI